MGSEKLVRLAKMMTMSAVDFLDEWFESDVLKAPMAVSGIIGTFLGVRSPGTAYVLLHHYMGELDGAFAAWGAQQGGTGGVSYLKRMLEIELFPELWHLRTNL